jgi:P-type E1-E2 ATPase
MIMFLRSALAKLKTMAKAVPHVVEASFDPVNNLLKVKVHKGMTSPEYIIKKLRECSVHCEQRRPAHEMVSMEHESMKMKKPMADLIRDESREAIKKLKAEGLEVAMLTGDNKQTAAYVAKELGLDMFFAEVLPDQKASTIKSLQDQGKRVAMVGDGINDAPALVQANVGIAIGAGTDVAIQSADIVLIKNDPRDVAKLVLLSRRTMRKMNENLWWATGYNVVAIPVAAGILVPFRVVPPPEIAAVTLTVSSISVTVNALLLRREKI